MVDALYPWQSLFSRRSFNISTICVSSVTFLYCSLSLSSNGCCMPHNIYIWELVARNEDNGVLSRIEWMSRLRVLVAK